MSKNERLMELDLNLIVFDEELKVRIETDETTAKEYYDAMETEEDVKKFPPPTVYFDGCRYWLADGHHRYLAVSWRGFKKMVVRVIDGSHDEAILAAVKLNMNHGLRFKEGDWERIVTLIAGKEQWKDWSNRTLAKELHCSEITIRRYRPESSGATAVAPEKRRGKDGKMYPAKMKKNEPVATKSPQADATVTESKKPIPSLPETESLVTVSDSKVAETFESQSKDALEIDETEETPSSDRRRIEANVKETQILATISQLQIQIAEWFEIAPKDMYEGFDKRLRKRIGELID